jgi:predicted DNA-binding transcriptional regulator YafY
MITSNYKMPALRGVQENPMRADRLLSIVLLLQVHGRLSAGELTRRLEVSRGTIYRNMEVLSAAGIPVAAERGTGGSWFLLDTYQTKLTGLNPTEIQALFLPKPDHVLSDLGLHQASEAALVKLLASLPAMYRDDAEFIRQRVHVDATGHHHNDEDISFLPTIQQALWQGRRLQLVYHLSTGPIIEPVLDPLGLVAKGSVWYLVAMYDDRIGVYRVSRVQDARIVDQASHRPGDFDLAAYWQASAEQYMANRPRYPVTLRVERGPNPGRSWRRAGDDRPDRFLGRVPRQKQVCASAKDNASAFHPGALFFKDDWLAYSSTDPFDPVRRHQFAQDLASVCGIQAPKEDQVLVLDRIGHGCAVDNDPFQAQVLEQGREIAAKARVYPIRQDDRVVRPQLVRRYLHIVTVGSAVIGKGERPDHQDDRRDQRFWTFEHFS